jgi:predicted SAM-dependent methyltransferase
MPAWVSAPDIKIEFCRGAFRVSVPGQSGYVDVHDAAVLNLLRLSMFPETSGKTVEPAGSNPEFSDRPEDNPGSDKTLHGYFNAFRQIGAIIPDPGAQSDRADPPVSMEAQRPGRFSGVQPVLRSIDRNLRKISGDVAAFGPKLDADFSLIWPLVKCLAALERVSAEMLRRRSEYVDSQLHRIGVTRETTGLRLHLGAGQYPLEGWINIDRYPAQLGMDLNWGLPFADGSVDYVFFSHTLEHFYYPGEALAILKEIRRVLSGSGKVRIVVPDMGKCLKAYAEDDDDFFVSRRRVWTWWPKGEIRLVETLGYAGAGASSVDSNHKFGYDFVTLRSLLIQAGFAQIEQSEYMRSQDPILRLDDASLIAGATFKGGYYSLFVEATA